MRELPMEEFQELLPVKMQTNKIKMRLDRQIKIQTILLDRIWMEHQQMLGKTKMLTNILTMEERHSCQPIMYVTDLFKFIEEKSIESKLKLICNV